MTIHLRRLRLTIAVSQAPASGCSPEELAAAGLDDRDLARLNQARHHDPMLDHTVERWLVMHGVRRV